MADINQVISLGIGQPAGIEYITTFGLGSYIFVATPAGRIFTVPAEDRTYIIPAETRVITVEAD
jgi:hypothetical protein